MQPSSIFAKRFTENPLVSTDSLVFFLGGQPPRPPMARFARALRMVTCSLNVIHNRQEDDIRHRFLGGQPQTPRGSLREGPSYGNLTRQQMLTTYSQPTGR